jgi:predicted secreted hydrolase
MWISFSFSFFLLAAFIAATQHVNASLLPEVKRLKILNQDLEPVAENHRSWWWLTGSTDGHSRSPLKSALDDRKR